MKLFNINVNNSIHTSFILLIPLLSFIIFIKHPKFKTLNKHPKYKDLWLFLESCYIILSGILFPK